MKINIETEAFAELVRIKLGQEFTIQERDEYGYTDYEYILDESGVFLETYKPKVITNEYHINQIVIALLRSIEERSVK